MLKVKIASLKYNLGRAQAGRLTRNFSICGFLLICPKNGQSAKITYNGSVVGEVVGGKVFVNDFEQRIWRGDSLKYDILHELKNQLNGDVEDVTAKEIVDNDEEDNNTLQLTNATTGGLQDSMESEANGKDSGGGEVKKPVRKTSSKRKSNSAAAKKYLSEKKKTK